MNVSSNAFGSSDKFLNTVFHPSDFSKDSEIAFAHALKIALSANSKLELFHVTAESRDSNLNDFPGIRQTLERWNVLPEGITKRHLADLGLHIKKIIVSNPDTVRSVLHQLKKNAADLIVLATHQRKGISQWLHKPIAEPVSRQSAKMTLFVPHGVQGFVSISNGRVNLKQILIPIAHIPEPQPAVDTASKLAGMLKLEEATFILLYVGSKSDVPKVNIYEKKNWTWKTVARQGNIIDQILYMENEYAPDLIVMATQGHEGFVDDLLGSTTERILRNSRCPVLAIPDNQKH